MASPVNLQRRRVPRRSFDSAAGILIAGKYLMERSYQLGEGGMMFACRETLTVGTQIVASFYVHSQTLIVVRGVVRSVIPADAGMPVRYGLEFLNLGFQFKREIRNFVAAASRRSGPINV
jgi:c-di-GMP-binding flagellar brake protein YcgR